MSVRLIDKYFPADYCDSITRRIKSEEKIEPCDILSGLFNKIPGWVNLLMKVRNLLVKPFGIKGGDIGSELSGAIKEKNENEAIMGMDEKHLEFFVSVCILSPEKHEREITVVTVVRYHNKLGRLYFFFIRPFHKIIVPVMIDRIINKYT